MSTTITTKELSEFAHNLANGKWMSFNPWNESGNNVFRNTMQQQCSYPEFTDTKPIMLNEFKELDPLYGDVIIPKKAIEQFSFNAFEYIVQQKVRFMEKTYPGQDYTLSINHTDRGVELKATLIP